MKLLTRFILPCLFTIALTTDATAQRDPPVYDSFLPQINVEHDHENQRLQIALEYCKNGGPHEHGEHQCYLLAYLEQDELAILDLARDPARTGKHVAEDQRFLKELIDQKLVVKLDSLVAMRLKKEDRDEGPRRSGYRFLFEFTLANAELLEAAGRLANFSEEDYQSFNLNAKFFNQRLKFLVFVPVNDSAYATEVTRELQETPDFAHLMDTDTSILYFRPLPHAFGLRKFDDGRVHIAIN